MVGQMDGWSASWFMHLIPRGPEGVPKGSQGDPSKPQGSQETPRHFATKTSKLAEAFDKNWSNRAQNSNASTIFFWKCLKTKGFFSTFCVAVEARAGHYILPALNSARTPKCKHCLGKYIPKHHLKLSETQWFCYRYLIVMLTPLWFP